MKDEQVKNEQLMKNNKMLKQLNDEQIKDSQQKLEASEEQIYTLKRQIKPVNNPTIVGLVETFSKQFEQKYSKFLTNTNIQTQEYDFELFVNQVLIKLNLTEAYQNPSLGVQKIIKTVHPNSDSTFFEGYIFQIPNPSDQANSYDPNIKTKTFLMKTIKMLKTNGYLPKSEDESKQLLIPNLASMSIFKQYMASLKKNGIKKPPAFKFPQQYMMQAQTENDKYFYHVEELVDGELLKFNDSNLPLKDTPEAQFSNSLVYYSFKKLQEQAMLTNIQGIKSGDGTITLYDTVLCSQQGLSSDIDLGNEEISKMKELIEKDGKKYLGDFYEKIKDEFTE